MKVLITAGGTSESIDEVRILTNISTGHLGKLIAETFLVGDVHEVHYVAPKSAMRPTQENAISECLGVKYFTIIDTLFNHTVTDTKSVMNKMEELVPQVDIVIHAMAVSDFGFKPAKTKLKSNDPQAFIESLKERIVVNPKIISFIKKWNPNVILVGFKFEVGKTHDELIDIAYESLVRNDCDYVVANDKQEMKQAGEHIAYIVDKDKNIIKCCGKSAIANELLTLTLK